MYSEHFLSLFYVLYSASVVINTICSPLMCELCHRWYFGSIWPSSLSQIRHLSRTRQTSQKCELRNAYVEYFIWAMIWAAFFSLVVRFSHQLNLSDDAEMPMSLKVRCCSHEKWLGTFHFGGRTEQRQYVPLWRRVIFSSTGQCIKPSMGRVRIEDRPRQRNKIIKKLHKHISFIRETFSKRMN